MTPQEKAKQYHQSFIGMSQDAQIILLQALRDAKEKKEKEAEEIRQELERIKNKLNSMAQQTAVEWLIKIYQQTNKIDNFDLEVAKVMEQENLKEMYLKGIENYDPTFKRK
jgi:F0F1-type ATP synthase membrane subunit b/b'